jgi:hypothetical protein
MLSILNSLKIANSVQRCVVLPFGSVQMAKS